jgi:hypothetical protein
MYLLDKLPPYEINNDDEIKDIDKDKDINKNTKQRKSETWHLIYVFSFFFIVCFAIYNSISFLNVQIEYNNMLIYNNLFNDNQLVNTSDEYKKVSYNSILLLLIFDMILNMMYYIFTNILVNKNITGSRYHICTSIICVILIIMILWIVHINILYKINQYMNSDIMFNSSNYYILLKHIRISTMLYVLSYCMNIISVIFLI